MVMSTVWSLSKVETRTAWLEERGIGACSGREYRLARERRPRENIPPSPTGTFTAASMLTLIPVLFVFSTSHPLHPTCPIFHCTSFCPRHPTQCLCILLALLSVFVRFLPFHPYTSIPLYLVCMTPPPLCQNGVYRASDRLHTRPEVHHRAPGWRRRGRLR